MGLIICPICDDHSGICVDHKHECTTENIIKNVKRLEEEAATAKRNLDKIQNDVMMLLHTLPSLDGEEISVKTDWIRTLWKAAKCNWDGEQSADSFIARWLAIHRILCEAFDLFRGGRFNTKEPLLHRLTVLKEMCVNAQEILGYNEKGSSPLFLSPQDIIDEAKQCE